MKKICVLIVICVALVTLFPVSYAKTTLYSYDGRGIQVEDSQVEDYKKVGWYENWEDVVTKLYASDGRIITVYKADVDKYLAVGWHKNRDDVVVSMFAPGGKEIKVYKSQVQDYINVGWSAVPKLKITKRQAEKDSAVSYTNLSMTPQRWARVSAIQQFKYKKLGIAYAYLHDEVLTVVKPDGKFEIEAKHSLLGDVIADEEGNIYVVWGDHNSGDDHNKETMFISKYTSNGTHVKSTGFIGTSPLNEDGNTSLPFYAGNCDSAIAEGKLMVNYARKMYNGHQSNNVIGVNLSDMSPHIFEDTYIERYGMKFLVDGKRGIPYTSHSFNQRIIWSEHANAFVYADHGDAFERGFNINVGNKKNNIFHFYLPANADYNMSVVNETYAQLGGLLETDKGVVLVGASVKSLGENASSERQNLFVQVFNPGADEISEDMFVGGSKRTGSTSDDIYDNADSPLKEVTDYGVKWITNYTKADVVAPHAVVAGDKIVLLWNKSKAAEKNESTGPRCAILSSAGNVIMPPTKLGEDVVFNSNEDPIYHDGKVYWVAASKNGIEIFSLKITG